MYFTVLPRNCTRKIWTDSMWCCCTFVDKFRVENISVTVVIAWQNHVKGKLTDYLYWWVWICNIVIIMRQFATYFTQTVACVRIWCRLAMIGWILTCTRVHATRSSVSVVTRCNMCRDDALNIFLRQSLYVIETCTWSSPQHHCVPAVLLIGQS